MLNSRYSCPDQAILTHTEKMNLKTKILIPILLKILLSSQGLTQELNYNPSYKIERSKEPAPFPVIDVKNKSFLNLMDSVIAKYQTHFNQNYDSTLYFDVTFDIWNDSLIVDVVKSDFQAYDMFKNAYFESSKAKPLGSFELNEILFIIHEETPGIVSQFFNITSTQNILSTKRRKLTELGIYSEHQTFNLIYHVEPNEFKLIKKEISSVNFQDWIRKER